MSKERELLKQIQQFLQCDCEDIYGFASDIEELLTQPEPRQDSHCYWCDGEYDAGARLAKLEQEPVAWIDAGSLKSLQATTGYALRYLTNDTENLNVDDVPLYLAPPKPEPAPIPQRAPMTQREAYQRGYNAAVRDLKQKVDSVFNLIMEKDDV